MTSVDPLTSQLPPDADKREHKWVVNEAPSGRWPKLSLQQFWSSRDLIYFFAVRDLKVKYKQAFLGVAWAGIQPLFGAITFTILFNRLAHAQTTGPSFFAFALSGFGIWSYYSATVTAGTNSLVANTALLTKVSLPRVVPPTAALLPGFIDLSVALTLATIVAVASGGEPDLVGSLVGIPLGLIMLLMAVSGPVLLLSATLVKYRDASALVTFGLQILLFASPIAYPPEFVPEGWRAVLYLNPLAGALGLLRAGLVDTEMPSTWNVLLSLASAAVGLVVGLVHFRRSEREFADII